MKNLCQRLALSWLGWRFDAGIGVYSKADYHSWCIQYRSARFVCGGSGYNRRARGYAGNCHGNAIDRSDEVSQTTRYAKTLTAVEDLGNITLLWATNGHIDREPPNVKNVIADDKELFQRLAIASLETLDEKRKKFQTSFDKAFLEYVPPTSSKRLKATNGWKNCFWPGLPPAPGGIYRRQENFSGWSRFGWNAAYDYWRSEKRTIS